MAFPAYTRQLTMCAIDRGLKQKVDNLPMRRTSGRQQSAFKDCSADALCACQFHSRQLQRLICSIAGLGACNSEEESERMLRACAAQAGGNLCPENAAGLLCAQGRCTAGSCSNNGAKVLARVDAEARLPAHASSRCEAAGCCALLAAAWQVPCCQAGCHHHTGNDNVSTTMRETA